MGTYAWGDESLLIMRHTTVSWRSADYSDWPSSRSVVGVLLYLRSCLLKTFLFLTQFLLSLYYYFPQLLFISVFANNYHTTKWQKKKDSRRF